MTLGLTVTFENFPNYPCFRVFFNLIQFKRHKLRCLSKCVSFALFNYSPLSYIVVLALTSAVTYEFPGPTIKFDNFPGLENEIRKFHDFQVFHDLCEPLVTDLASTFRIINRTCRDSFNSSTVFVFITACG